MAVVLLVAAPTLATMSDVRTRFDCRMFSIAKSFDSNFTPHHWLQAFVHHNPDGMLRRISVRAVVAKAMHVAAP